MGENSTAEAVGTSSSIIWATDSSVSVLSKLYSAPQGCIEHDQFICAASGFLFCSESHTAHT